MEVVLVPRGWYNATLAFAKRCAVIRIMSTLATREGKMSTFLTTREGKPTQ
jgi:hypothetical protein